MIHRTTAKKERELAYDESIPGFVCFFVVALLYSDISLHFMTKPLKAGLDLGFIPLEAELDSSIG